jgi:hypothetical protein
LPAVVPARVSSEPKYISAPSFLYWSIPELKPTTGIPASIADLTAPARASGVTRVVAMPLTLESTAFWMRTACLGASGSLEYFRVTPVSLAACWAPFLTLSQNVSPGVSWVMKAIVYPELPAALPPPPVVLSSVFSRPPPEQAAEARATAVRAAATRKVRLRTIIGYLLG